MLKHTPKLKKSKKLRTPKNQIKKSNKKEEQILSTDVSLQQNFQQKYRKKTKKIRHLA